MIPVSTLHKILAGRYRPVRVADGPITVCYNFMLNASWGSGGRIPQSVEVRSSNPRVPCSSTGTTDHFSNPVALWYLIF